ncbi:MAG: hypothetical protein GDA45_02010 [Chromatiales bacterium]|nr:hypothetical protein [Chromatiales bacterium]
MALTYKREALAYATQLGMVACRWPAFKDYALAIFKATGIACPQSPASIIGEAMVYLNCDDDPEEAVNFLKKNNISGSSGPSVCRAFLGLCLYIAKRSSESQQVLKALVAESNDSNTDAIDLANKLLEQLEGK